LLPRGPNLFPLSSHDERIDERSERRGHDRTRFPSVRKPCDESLGYCLPPCRAVDEPRQARKRPVPQGRPKIDRRFNGGQPTDKHDQARKDQRNGLVMRPSLVVAKRKELHRSRGLRCLGVCPWTRTPNVTLASSDTRNHGLMLWDYPHRPVRQCPSCRPRVPLNVTRARSSRQNISVLPFELFKVGKHLPLEVVNIAKHINNEFGGDMRLKREQLPDAFRILLHVCNRYRRFVMHHV
jgi:hypothetical protein